MKNTEKIIALVGPTASGKTDIAINLAKHLDGEIISADSRLVYRDFNIGTAKPTVEEMSEIPHHLVDVADPCENFTVNIYSNEAGKVIEDILSRGKVPIIAGGTGFYVKALLEGLNIPEVSPDTEFREKMRQFVELNGRQALHDKLKEIDPVTAEKLYINDSFRIIRALEVIKHTGKLMSEVQTMSEPKYDIVYAGLNAEDREFLYDRINRRVDIMLEQGLIEEVENLINKWGKTVSILKTLGYKEVCDYLDGTQSKDEAVELIKKNTRNFAKRQLTWFRANKKIHWFYIDKSTKEEICKEIAGIYEL